MFIHFLCLCPLGLTMKLNFNISKVVYSEPRFTSAIKECYIGILRCQIRLKAGRACDFVDEQGAAPFWR